MKCIYQSTCLCCESSNIFNTFQLGNQPLANSYTNEYTTLEQFPLGLNTCNDCWHSQLTHIVSRQQIFDNYNYVSGTSRTLIDYFEWFANALKRTIEIGDVYEVAANDGSLLKELKQVGFSAEGIDPAVNIVSNAVTAGLKIQCGYFPYDVRDSKKYDVIIAMNVLAHVESPFEFMSGIASMLNDDGVAIIQPSQLRMFEYAQFDTIYHEHISFFNTKSISVLSKRAGLKLIEASVAKIHGDSPIYFFTKSNSNARIDISEFRAGVFGSNEDVFEYEKLIGLFSRECYDRFREKSTNVMCDLKTTIVHYEKMGYNLLAVGAAAKAMTVFGSLNMDIQFVDEASLKVGRFPPCSSHRVIDFAQASVFSPSLFIICAWNFAEEIMSKLKALGSSKDNIYLVYFPTLKKL